MIISELRAKLSIFAFFQVSLTFTSIVIDPEIGISKTRETMIFGCQSNEENIVSEKSEPTNHDQENAPKNLDFPSLEQTKKQSQRYFCSRVLTRILDIVRKHNSIYSRGPVSTNRNTCCNFFHFVERHLSLNNKTSSLDKPQNSIIEPHFEEMIDTILTDSVTNAFSKK